MPIQLVGFRSVTGGSGTITVPLTGLTGGIDTQARAGDLVIASYAVVSTSNLALSILTAGYSTESALWANDTRDANLRTGVKIMDVTPDADVQFSGNATATNGAIGMVRVYRGIDPTTPLDVATQTATGTNSAVPNPPAITPVSAGAVIVIFGAGTGAAVDTSITVPTGYGNHHSNSFDPGNAIIFGSADKAWSGSGADDPAAWGGVTTSTSDAWAAVTLALRPLPADTTAPILSGQTVDTITAHAGTPKVTTDEGNGTAYMVVVPDGDIPSVAQIKAGQRSNGTAAIASENKAVAAAGQIVFAALSGLTSNTAFDVWFVHRDAAGNDSASVKADFSTALAFDDTRQEFINLLSSTGGTDIDAVKAALTPANVARTSDTVVTLTLPAVPGYDIPSDVEWTTGVPGEAVVGGGPDLFADPVTIGAATGPVVRTATAIAITVTAPAAGRTAIVVAPATAPVVTVTPQAATLFAPRTVAATSSAITVSAPAATIAATRTVTAGAPTITITLQATSIPGPVIRTATAPTITITTPTATAKEIKFAQAGSPTISITLPTATLATIARAQGVAPVITVSPGAAVSVPGPVIRTSTAPVVTITTPTATAVILTLANATAVSVTVTVPPATVTAVRAIAGVAPVVTVTVPAGAALPGPITRVASPAVVTASVGAATTTQVTLRTAAPLVATVTVPSGIAVPGGIVRIGVAPVVSVTLPAATARNITVRVATAPVISVTIPAATVRAAVVVTALPITITVTTPEEFEVIGGDVIVPDVVGARRKRRRAGRRFSVQAFDVWYLWSGDFEISIRVPVQDFTFSYLWSGTFEIAGSPTITLEERVQFDSVIEGDRISASPVAFSLQASEFGYGFAHDLVEDERYNESEISDDDRDLLELLALRGL